MSRTNPTNPRLWQRRALAEMAGWTTGPFLISAAPGAGKTRPSLELARRVLAAGGVDRVVVVCPTAPLTRQWAAAAALSGVQLAPDAPSPLPPKDFHGVAVTYARIAWRRPVVERADVDRRTLVIADEAHHLGEDLAWGDGFARCSRPPSAGCCCRARRSARTPPRSRACATTATPWLAEPDMRRISYGDAVRDGVCRPVCVHHLRRHAVLALAATT